MVRDNEALGDSVTDTQNFGEGISPSRNADADKDKRPPACGCAWCGAEWRPGQTRFPIIVDWHASDYDGGSFSLGVRLQAIIASLCLDCFKDAPSSKAASPGAIARVAREY